MKANSKYDGWDVFRKIALIYAQHSVEDMRKGLEVLKNVKLKDESKTTQED